MGQITKRNWILCELAKPDYGYITNFGKAHLEGFGGVEEWLIEGKSEMYNLLSANDKLLYKLRIPFKLKIKDVKGIFFWC
jgi:UDP-N-acetylmuramoyl-tripeptide--D-alanyl-D-alanine ligase